MMVKKKICRKLGVGLSQSRNEKIPKGNANLLLLPISFWIPNLKSFQASLLDSYRQDFRPRYNFYHGGYYVIQGTIYLTNFNIGSVLCIVLLRIDGGCSPSPPPKSHIYKTQTNNIPNHTLNV